MSNYRHITYKIAHMPYYADMSILPYSATYCDMAYLPYFRYGSSQFCHAENSCINNYLPSLLNRFSVAMPEMARIYCQAGRQPKICPVGKNLSGVCATGRDYMPRAGCLAMPGSVNFLDHGSTHRIIRAVRFMSNLPHFAVPRPCRS
jgi:hypothetical protein